MKKIKRPLLFILSSIILCSAEVRAQGPNWDQIIKAVASDRASSDQFGRSVAISGDYAIVGALFESELITSRSIGGYYFLGLGPGASCVLKYIRRSGLACRIAAAGIFVFTISPPNA